jgi:large subunit ribosomal protein L18
VFRSLKHIYAQVIDDEQGRTVASASTREPELSSELSGKTKSDQAKLIGRIIAERSKASGVGTVVFDRGGFKYHGRVRQLADNAREAGLEF